MNPEQTQSSDALAYHPSKVAWATAELVRTPPPLATHVFILLLLIFLVSGFTYSYLAIVPISIRVNGLLVSDKKSFPITSLNTARVTDLPIADGAFVKKGTPLLSTDQQLDAAGIKRLQKDVNAVMAVVRRDAAGRCTTSCGRDLNRLVAEAFSVRAPSPLKESLIQLQDMLREYATAWGNITSSGGLVAEQYRQIRAAQDKLAMIHAKSADGLLTTEIEAIDRDIGTARTQIAERSASLASARQQARDRLEVRLGNLAVELEDFTKSSVYLAPTDGVIANLSISGVGQTITTGQKLLDIMPTDAHLVAEVSVPNKDIARVVVGMPAKIVLDAFPERDYGDIPATIVTIPANNVEDKDPKAPTDYRVRLSVNKQSFSRHGYTYPFRLGMTLSSQIILRRERLLTLGIRRALNLENAWVGK